jgi:hypothetical protein
MKRSLATLLGLLAVVAGTVLAGVPSAEYSVDSQAPAATWTVKTFAGATPLIRVRLKEIGTNWTAGADWPAFFWYGTNASWAATSTVTIAGTISNGASYVDFQAVSNTFPTAGTYYGGVVMTNATRAFEWGRGYVQVLSSGGIISSGVLDLRGNTIIIDPVARALAANAVTNGGVTLVAGTDIGLSSTILSNGVAITISNTGGGSTGGISAATATGIAYVVTAQWASTGTVSKATTVTGAQSNLIASALQAEADTLSAVAARGNSWTGSVEILKTNAAQTSLRIGSTNMAEFGEVEQVRENDNARYVSTVIGSSGTAGFFGRRALGTMASPSAITTDNTMLFLGAFGYDGSAFTSASKGAFLLSAAENWNAGSQGVYFAWLLTPTGSTTRTERMRLTGVGLGIATNSPAALLDVNGGAILRGATTNVGPLFALGAGGNVLTNGGAVLVAGTDIGLSSTTLTNGAAITISYTGGGSTGGISAATATGIAYAVVGEWATTGTASKAATATTVTGTQSNTIAAAWQNPASATNWTWFVTNEEVIITGYTGPNECVVPDILDGRYVVALSGKCFMPGTYNEDIASVTGGRYVRSLIGEVFWDLGLLTNVTLPAVTSIGGQCFYGVTSLESATFGAVTNIESLAFGGSGPAGYCTSLRAIYFGGNAPTIAGDSYLLAVNITNYVTNPTATGWGSTLGGRPVVRMPVYADEYWRLGTNLTTLLAEKLNTNDARYLAALTNGGCTINGLTVSNGASITIAAGTSTSNSMLLYANGVQWIPVLPGETIPSNTVYITSLHTPTAGRWQMLTPGESP